MGKTQWTKAPRRCWYWWRTLGSQWPQPDSLVLHMPTWWSVATAQNWWNVLYVQVGVAPQSRVCSVLYKLITSREDKSSANFSGISVCEMCTALRIRLSSGESPGSSHPRGRRFKHRDTSPESRVLNTWQQIGVWASAAQCQCHFMGNSCAHIVASVCEKVMRERGHRQAAHSIVKDRGRRWIMKLQSCTKMKPLGLVLTSAFL